MQAKCELVESYKRLRTEDAAPGSSTSYRITVRQLEALVRLSEALARLRCSEVITPAYVREVSGPCGLKPCARNPILHSLLAYQHSLRNRKMQFVECSFLKICISCAGAAAGEEQHHCGGGA